MLSGTGALLHVWVGGPERGPAVVFTHGAGTDHRMFDRQVEAVQQAGFRSVRWDVAGHGSSRPLTGPFSVRSAARDLTRVLDHLGLERVALVGQSMGGNIAQDVVLDDPSRSWVLVAIGSTCHTLPIPRRQVWLLRVSHLLLAAWPYRGLRRSMVRVSAVTPEAQHYLTEVFADLTRAEFLRVWGGMTRSLDPRPGYRSSVPHLLLLGERDRTGNIRVAMRRWAEREHAELHVLPGAGHVANLDRPEEVNRLMIDFLRRHAGREGTGER